MALARRAADWQDDLAEDRADEPLISVGFDDFFGDEGAGDDVAWCIDYGDGIDVMNTAQIRAALTSGWLSADRKAWRDGNPCWLRLRELPEFAPLVPQASPSLLWVPDDTVPEQSHVRRSNQLALSEREGTAVISQPTPRYHAMRQLAAGALAMVVAVGAPLAALGARPGRLALEQLQPGLGVRVEALTRAEDSTALRRSIRGGGQPWHGAHSTAIAPASRRLAVRR